MTAGIQAPLWARLVALAVLFAISGQGANKKSRMFSDGFDDVWTAAVDVAKGAFITDKISVEEHRLRFRTGPLRGYRFEVVVIEIGVRKTRVDLELRKPVYGSARDGWRSGGHYLTLLGQRLRGSSRK